MGLPEDLDLEVPTRPSSARRNARRGFAITGQDDPLKATLKGKVRIFARYGGDVEVDSLKLVRDKADGKKWRLDHSEVERTAKLRKVDPRSRVRE